MNSKHKLARIGESGDPMATPNLCLYTCPSNAKIVASTHNFNSSQNCSMGIGGSKMFVLATRLRLSMTNSIGTFVNNAVTSRLTNLQGRKEKED